MFPRSVSALKTMIFAVALFVSTVVATATGPVNACVPQKHTVVDEYKLSTLDHLFGEILTTESNGNIYVISICRPIHEMFYDPRRLVGSIKLTADGNTIDLGHIDQSNVIVNENNIVLTYVGGDRDINVKDSCKGMRWKTYLNFVCDPLAIHDTLTLIDEDPDQPEICQVWFEVKTTKTCNRQPHIPLVFLEKHFSTLKNQTDHEKFRVREPTNSNKIPFGKNAFDYETINSNKNNISLNIENKENFNTNDLVNKFNKSLNDENFSTSKVNKTTNEEIKNGNSPQIISKVQKNQLDYENKDNYLRKFEKYEKEEARGSNSKTNISEEKNSANIEENNKLWIKQNMSRYENKEHYPSNDLENKFTDLKINKTMPGIWSNKEHSYPEKNTTILNYNNLKQFLNQNKNSEGKYENSVIMESTNDENKNGRLNQDFPGDASNNDIKYENSRDSENIEKASKPNTFVNKISNKEINDSSANEKPSDNEKKLNQDNSKESNLNNDLRTYNKTPNSDNGIKYKTIDEGKLVDPSNQRQSKDNKSIIDVNQTHSQKNNPESKSFQKADQKNEIEKNSMNVNGSITESTPRDDSENKPAGSGDKGVDANNINATKYNIYDVNPTTEPNEENNMKNNNNSTSGSDNNTLAVTVEPTENSSSNTIVNDRTNPSGEVYGSSTESSVAKSLNSNKTNDKSESNGTVINEFNNVKKNLQPDQSTSVPSGHSSDDNESDNSKTTTNSTNQPGDGFSFNTLFSKMFPNGMQVSATTIIGVLGSLAVVTGAVGTAINRYYYKLSGTDQIPFKETFQSIFNFIKVIFITIITTICCCCRGGVYDDLEAPDLTNEKTPLLQPKFNISTPLLVDETSQKSKKRNKKSDDGKQQKSDSADNDDSSKQNSNSEYGSVSKERKSSETKYRKIKRKSKTSDKKLNDSTPENESLAKNVKEKLINIEDNLQGKSMKQFITGKINTMFTEKVKPTVNNIIEKVGKKVESTEEIKKNLDIISKDAALISKFVENEKSKKNIDDVLVDVEIKSENNSVKEHTNEIETQNILVQDQIKSKTLGESQQSPNVKPISEVIVSNVSIPDLQQIKRNEQASNVKPTSSLDRVSTEKLIENTQNKEKNIEKLQDTVVTSPIDTKSKINESKLKFLGLEKEDKNAQKVLTNESIVPDKKIENEEDDSVEVIEEVIYIDGSDGAEEEEIIEEIIETTTVEDSPDNLDKSLPGAGHTKVTVRTTRKISSSSLPGEVKTIEEIVVTDDIPENEKKQSGFHLGVGKSGVSMSVGDNKLKIGKSGLKLNRSKSKSPKNVEGDEPDKRDTKSPEKSKKSMSLPKIFKRSISQPSDTDIQESEGESQLDSAPAKKLSRTGSGLLKFGKSGSKSSLVLKTGDVTMDTDVMSSFLNNERRASSKSDLGLGELDITVGDENVAASVVVRKTSTTSTEGKDNLVSIDTAGTSSPIDLGIGPAKDQQSTKNANTKSNAKTKREKKDKTKLTTLTRPF